MNDFNMVTNDEIFLNLQKNREDKSNFIKYSIEFLKNNKLENFKFNNEISEINFKNNISEISELRDDILFQKKVKNIIINYEKILEKLEKFNIKEIDSIFEKEFTDFLSNQTIKTQSIFFEFNHYHSPRPFIQFYGRNKYKLLDGSIYEGDKFYGESIGWFESKMDFKILYEPIYDLKWLENDFGLNDFFYGFVDYILSEIFIIMNTLIKKRSAFLKNEKILLPLYYYIRESEIEAFSLFLVENNNK